jgi:hypothetical protein
MRLSTFSALRRDLEQVQKSAFRLEPKFQFF